MSGRSQSLKFVSEVEKATAEFDADYLRWPRIDENIPRSHRSEDCGNRISLVAVDAAKFSCGLYKVDTSSRDLCDMG